MKKPALLFFALLLSFGVRAQSCADTANIYSFMFDGKHYEVVKEKKTWANAAACAFERGGYLAHIESQEENDSIYDAILNGAGVSTSYATAPDGGGIAYVWIGATDKALEGKWLWDGDGDDTGINFWNGQGFAGTGGGVAVGGAYMNWGGIGGGVPNEPDDFGSGQDAAGIALNGWPGGSGSLGVASEWNDIAASNSLYFVIEYDSVATSATKARDETSGMKISPNPGNDFMYLEFDLPSGKIEFLSIWSIAGQKVASYPYSEFIDISALPAGLYLLKTEGDWEITKRIVISR